VVQAFDPALRTDARELPLETLRGPQADDDPKAYRAWHKLDTRGGPAGKYLVDEAGHAVYFVDPGINGTHRMRPDGSTVAKFDAPKATLMSYIIKGMLNRELPWGLVLLGAMISVVLELCGIGSLPFAVGVYLPISSSTPIFAGGVVRWLVDRRARTRSAARKLSEQELSAESDKSPGVLLASGYIAGGAIAGIVIAFVAGVIGHVQDRIDGWAKEHNPLFSGPHSDALSLLPFVALAGLLYWVSTRGERGKENLPA
jgi:hypothetical protein